MPSEDSGGLPAGAAATLRRNFLRLLRSLRPGPAERELNREVESHLTLLQDEFEQKGLSSGDARLAARRALVALNKRKNSIARHADFSGSTIF